MCIWGISAKSKLKDLAVTGIGTGLVVALVSILLCSTAVLAGSGGTLDGHLGIRVCCDQMRGLVAFSGWGGSLDGHVDS